MCRPQRDGHGIKLDGRVGRALSQAPGELGLFAAFGGKRERMRRRHYLADDRLAQLHRPDHGVAVGLSVRRHASHRELGGPGSVG